MPLLTTSVPREAFFSHLCVSCLGWSPSPLQPRALVGCVLAETEGPQLDWGRVYTKPGPYVVWLRDSREGAPLLLVLHPVPFPLSHHSSHTYLLAGKMHQACFYLRAFAHAVHMAREALSPDSTMAQFLASFKFHSNVTLSDHFI